jgi:FkbM family methyltransferase
VRVLAGHLFVRFLAPLAWLRRTPFVGRMLHALSYGVLPAQTRIWIRVRKGAARGLWIRVNPRTGRHLYDGTNEPLVQDALTKHLKSGMVFYDLGANLGFFTLIGARSVGASGKVFAFEPDPELCQRLSENVTRNGFSNVEIVQAAVCSTSGSTAFTRADPQASPDRGVGRIGTGLPGSSIIRVRTVTLDDFVRHAEPPDVVKCDVEGAEIEALEGARLMLERHRPLILCEVHSEVGADSVRQLLVGSHYTVGWLDGNHLYGSSQRT